jgi:hypothetical protein
MKPFRHGELASCFLKNQDSGYRPALDPQIDDQQRHKILDELKIFRQHQRRNGPAS